MGGLSFLERFSILMDWRRIYRDRFQYANRTHYPHSEPGVEEYSKEKGGHVNKMVCIVCEVIV